MNMSIIERAIEIALLAHKGQKDKSGVEYILHPLRVMERGRTEVEKICGVLHDVVEDSNWTIEDLINEGFSEEIISAIKCLTKKTDNEDYDEFIERVAKDPIAVQVKLNDLLDNMDITRLDEIREHDLHRLNKYLRAYKRLNELKELRLVPKTS